MIAARVGWSVLSLDGCRRLRSCGLLVVALAGVLGLTGPVWAQTPPCENQGGYCKPLNDSECGVDYVQDDGVAGCFGQTVCCLPKVCSARGGLCQQTETCGSLTSLGSTSGCPSCCEPPPYTPEMCAQKGGDICSQDLSCPAGAIPKGASLDCVMCCASSGVTGTCDLNSVCASGEPCSCSDCSTAARCQGGSGDGTYKVEYLHTDALGSVRLVTDQDGAVVSRWDYLPYGGEVDAGFNARTTIEGYATGPTAREQFTGKERDGESQLDYSGARYYSGAQGRFTTPDLPFADQHLGDPQSWNLFSYARNNPLKFVDATGRKVRVADAIALEHVRSTLPKNDRQFLRLGENGFVDGGALAKASKHGNVTDLIDLVNSDSLVSVRTAAKVNLKGFGELEFSYETAEEAVATLKKHGIDADPNTVTQNAFSGYTFGDDPKNVEVVLPDNTGTAAKAPISHRATYAAHELFGHAARRVKGQPWLHDDGGPVDQAIIKIEDRTKALYDESRKIK